MPRYQGRTKLESDEKPQFVTVIRMILNVIIRQGTAVDDFGKAHRPVAISYNESRACITVAV